MERALLQLSGERGYGSASVDAVVTRSESNRSRFYATYASRADCYASAYERAMGVLEERVLAPCAAAPDWTTGMGAALEEMEGFIDEDPAVAAGVIREVHVAGGAALSERRAFVERLATAIDRARDEGSEADCAPPPATPLFVIAAIEATVIRNLTEGRPVREALGGLFFLAVASYFGTPAARQALDGYPRWR
jgi:AcrR family transcriptional regulator